MSQAIHDMNKIQLSDEDIERFTEALRQGVPNSGDHSHSPSCLESQLTPEMLDNVNAKGRCGTTLLHIASALSADATLALIKHGANIEATDVIGRTPLHHAVMNRRDTTFVLLDNGADDKARDNNG